MHRSVLVCSQLQIRDAIDQSQHDTGKQSVGAIDRRAALGFCGVVLRLLAGSIDFLECLVRQIRWIASAASYRSIEAQYATKP